MAQPAVKFTQPTAKLIRKAVQGYLGEANDQYGRRPRRLSFQKLKPTWIKIGKPVGPASLGSTDGGGGYYNCKVGMHSPLAINTSVDLQIPIDEINGEAFSDAAIAENTLEANLSPGDEPSHWVPYGTIVPAWRVGTTVAGTPVYRFTLPIPGPLILKIIGAQGSSGAGGGSGRYKANPVYSRPTSQKLVGTSGGISDGLFLPDHGETYAPPGSDEDDSITNPAKVCYENAVEDGINGYPGHCINLLPIDGTKFVVGYFTGGYSDGTSDGEDGMPTPIYRGDTPFDPHMRCSYYDGSQTGGSIDATTGAITPPNYTYNVFVPNTDGTANAQQILSNQDPRSNGFWGSWTVPVVGAATWCRVSILPNGTLVVMDVNEMPVVGTCSGA